MLAFETRLWAEGVRHVAGIDEAGRGPLAGPVVAAAVIASPEFFLPEVDDSKRLSPAQREHLYHAILAGALAAGVGIVDNDVIDCYNILNATYLAMHRAVENLSVVPDHLLIDGNRFDPGFAPLLEGRAVDQRERIPFTTIVKGDSRSFLIAAASIVAKVTRDRLMTELDARYPGYGFARHKGYGTEAHREAIVRMGLCPIHRRSFHCAQPEEKEQ